MVKELCHNSLSICNNLKNAEWIPIKFDTGSFNTICKHNQLRLKPRNSNRQFTRTYMYICTLNSLKFTTANNVFIKCCKEKSDTSYVPTHLCKYNGFCDKKWCHTNANTTRQDCHYWPVNMVPDARNIEFRHSPHEYSTEYAHKSPFSFYLRPLLCCSLFQRPPILSNFPPFQSNFLPQWW